MTTLDTILAQPRPDTDAMRERIVALAALLPAVGDPADADALLALLRMLYRIGRADLPLARLFEGHVDACQIVARYGGADTVADDALGVWNAALAGEPLRVEDGRLIGGKAYASGAGTLTHALAGADTPQGNRLVLIDLAASSPAIDRDWWRTLGMQRSHTHLVRWHGAPPDTFRFIGAPGDYAREPWFSGGALRFVAIHAGGVAALFDQVRDHLIAAARADDPHQSTRLASLYGLAQSAASTVRATAQAWGTEDEAYPARVSAARLAVTDAAERAIVLAQAAVGLPGMFADHPLSTTIADLTVYLRQPAPDAQGMRVARACADGLLVPAL
ncbi:acyl-CoA dehydrogenase [Sphingomonas sp.]|uniref:acyl-CoA dehydrogenase n=1 Tax=Sphingomonas sp. TaxID=28214 RepID=UPI0035BBEB0C